MSAVQSPERILQRLDWTVIRRLDGILQGDYRTLFHGFGLDLAELREYQPSDDIRYIDWNVTARLQTPYIRQYMEDREVSAWFLLDLSPSMDFGTAQMFKRSLLIDCVTTLARVLTRHGNRVGAILFNGKSTRVIPARGGKAHVLRLIKDMHSQPPLKRAPPTDLTVLLKTAFRTIRRRSLIFIVSDFISTPGWERALGMLAQRHEVLAMRLYDPREMELPDIGPITIEDAETGEQLYLDPHDAGFRRQFAEAVRRQQYELDVAFRRAAVDAVDLSTEDDIVEQIVRFARLRRQRKMNPASFAK